MMYTEELRINSRIGIGVLFRELVSPCEDIAAKALLRIVVGEGSLFARPIESMRFVMLSFRGHDQVP